MPVALAHEVHGAPTAAATTRAPAWFLLHAFPLHRAMWAPQRRLAAQTGARFVVPDLRGFGGSPPGPRAPGEPATMDAMAGDVLALADRLGLRRFGVMGCSMGGYVALALQRAAPERVAAMVLVDTQARADTAEARRKRAELAEAVRREGHAPLLRGTLPALIGPRFAEEPPLLDALQGMVRANPLEGIVAALRGMALRLDLRDHLREVRCPVLAVVGSDDQVTPPPLAREIAETAPDGALRVLPRAGHLSAYERPGAFAEAVVPFLGRAR